MMHDGPPPPVRKVPRRVRTPGLFDRPGRVRVAPPPVGRPAAGPGSASRHRRASRRDYIVKTYISTVNAEWYTSAAVVRYMYLSTDGPNTRISHI